MQAAPGAPKMHFPKNMPPLPEPPSSPEVQKALFTYEISIAAKYALPVNVHCLHGAHADAMKILRAHPGLRGIAHSFEGDMAMLRDWLDLGFLIALGTKQVIGEPLPDLEAIVRAIPPDRLVVETDANPMMSPENGPVDVIPVVRKLAAIRGASEAAIGQQTTVNLKKCLQR
jgi:TatD DNase family protein